MIVKGACPLQRLTKGSKKVSYRLGKGGERESYLLNFHKKFVTDRDGTQVSHQFLNLKAILKWGLMKLYCLDSQITALALKAKDFDG